MIRVTSPDPPADSLPSGIVVAWPHSDAVPSGWYKCDGSNGTDDLRGRFLRGVPVAGVVGSTGGASTHHHTGGEHCHGAGTLEAESHGHEPCLQMPAHDHCVSSNISTGWAGCGCDVTVVTCAEVCGTSGSCGPLDITGTITGAGALAVSGSTAAAGAVDTDERSHLPPYFDTHFIMKA